MVEEDQVTGAGWVSDDSSFYGEYRLSPRSSEGSTWPWKRINDQPFLEHASLKPAGDDEEQDRQHSLLQTPHLSYIHSPQTSDLNAVLAPVRAQSCSKAISKMHGTMEKVNLPSGEGTTESRPQSNSKPPNVLLDRAAMEEERLARIRKRKRKPSPGPILSNPGQGSLDAWQLEESVDDFVRRLPPLTTSVLTCPWIWAHNPHRHPHDGSFSHKSDEFKSRGMDLLDQSLYNRQQIQSKGQRGPKPALIKSLNQESKALQQHINDLAVECKILSGKWMLFPKLEEVTRVWKEVVAGVIDGRLGPTAKVAPDEGKPDDRLICVYTIDFRDEEDVLRVLQQLQRTDLLGSGHSIYYKSDAFTYLGLYKQTASKYGLQASLYASHKMMAAGNASKSTSISHKKQSILNNFT